MSQPTVMAWLDLETTDTDETLRHSAIVEVGVVFTDFNLMPIQGDATEHFVVNPGYDDDKQRYIDENDLPGRLTPEQTLDGIWFRMDPIVQQMHTTNGLWAEVEQSRLSTKGGDEILAATLEEVGDGRRVALAGSGVGHFDKLFLRKHFPLSFPLFDYGPYDVGSVRRFLRLAGVDTAAADPHQTSSGVGKKHRALDDAWAHWQEALVYVSAFKELSLT